MDCTALDRVLVHVRRGSRVVKQAVDPVARGELARLETAFGERG